MDFHLGVSTGWPGMFAPYVLRVGLSDIFPEKGRGMRVQSFWLVDVIKI